METQETQGTKENKAVPPKKRVKSIFKIPEKNKRKEPFMRDGKTIYVVPAKERKVFHVELEDTNYDNKTGKKKSKPYIVKLDGLKEYRQFMIGISKSGAEHKLLHDPRPYYGMSVGEIKENEASIEKVIKGK